MPFIPKGSAFEQLKEENQRDNFKTSV